MLRSLFIILYVVVALFTGWSFSWINDVLRDRAGAWWFGYLIGFVVVSAFLCVLKYAMDVAYDEGRNDERKRWRHVASTRT